MAITLDGTTGITTPGITSSANISGDVVTGNVFSTTASPPTIKNSAGTEIGTFARAWVYFDASTGTPNVQSSFNVSSITDNGVGNFTVNFGTAMPDALYVAMTTAESGNSVSPRTSQSTSGPTAANFTFSTKTFQSGVSAGANQDMNYNKVIVFR